MDRPGHHNTKLFVGTEVEHSPAYGQKTLFVVGIQENDLIEAAVIAHKCTHIYFGANQSFPKIDTNNADWTRWENMIIPFLSLHSLTKRKGVFTDWSNYTKDEIVR
jgi:hypothetical protein